MLKTAKAGKPVIEEDIPPTVALGAKPKVDSSENDTSGLENAFPSAKPSSLSTEAAPNPSNESKSPIVSPTPPPLPPRMKSSPSSELSVSQLEGSLKILIASFGILMIKYLLRLCILFSKELYYW